LLSKRGLLREQITNSIQNQNRGGKRGGKTKKSIALVIKGNSKTGSPGRPHSPHIQLRKGTTEREDDASYYGIAALKSRGGGRVNKVEALIFQGTARSREGKGS